MEKIILKAPFNSLSLGNVSYNIARELYKKGISTSIFPKGNNFEFDAFDKFPTLNPASDNSNDDAAPTSVKIADPISEVLERLS